MTRLSRTQLAALGRLADGGWHSLASFKTHTVNSLLVRKTIEVRWNNGPLTADVVDYRITDAGRAACWTLSNRGKQ